MYDVSICVLSYVLVSRWTLRIKKIHEGKSLQYIVVWFIAFCQAKCPSMPILLAEESRENLLHCRSYIRPRNERGRCMPSSAVPSTRTNATGTRSTSRSKCRSTSRLQTASTGKGEENSGEGGGTPYNGLYGEAPPERGTFF